CAAGGRPTGVNRAMGRGRRELGRWSIGGALRRCSRWSFDDDQDDIGLAGEQAVELILRDAKREAWGKQRVRLGIELENPPSIEGARAAQSKRGHERSYGRAAAGPYDERRKRGQHQGQATRRAFVNIRHLPPSLAASESRRG